MQETKKNTTNNNDDEDLFIPFEDLTIRSNFMFTKVFSHEDIAKPFIEDLFNIKVDHLEIVREASLEDDPNQHGVRFDVFIKEKEGEKIGRVFDLEMQMKDTYNLPLRARYYEAMCDSEVLDRGASYDELKEQYIIFLCPNDFLHAGRIVYEFENLEINDPKIKLGDLCYKKFYIFNKYKDFTDEKVQAYMRYFATCKPSSEATNAINNRVKHYKQSKSARKAYMLWKDDLKVRCKQWLEKGRAEGEQERQALQDENAQLKAEIAMLRAGHVSDVQADYKP